MTAAPHLTELDMIDHLSGRDDLTVDDIASLPEDLRYELIDGRLVLTPHALPIHQLINVRVCSAIDERCPDDFIVNGEQAVRLGRRYELRPDVVLIRTEGADRSPVLPADVELVVEIISRSSRTIDTRDKRKHYADLGIPLFWLIDPLAERVMLTELRLAADGAYEQQTRTDERITLDRPWAITLDPPSWTRKRDQIELAARRRSRA